MVIGNFELSTTAFAGQGDLIMFDPVKDYGVATIDSLASPRSLGQIVQDSTEWEGEAPEIVKVMDERGVSVTSYVKAGTMVFSFDIASTSLTMVQLFLQGERMPDLEEDWNEAVGFGVDLPVMTRPLMIINDELNRSWLYPRAKIVSSLSYDEGLWRIHAQVTVMTLKTKYLTSCMIIDGDVDDLDFYFGDLLLEDGGLFLLEDGDVLTLDSE